MNSHSKAQLHFPSPRLPWVVFNLIDLQIPPGLSHGPALVPFVPSLVPRQHSAVSTCCALHTPSFLPACRSLWVSGPMSSPSRSCLLDLNWECAVLPPVQPASAVGEEEYREEGGRGAEEPLQWWESCVYLLASGDKPSWKPRLAKTPFLLPGAMRSI